MKGIDIRKLAVVAGMGLLGISAVFGAVKYEDTTLVNDNGQPVAKVAVGTKAAISDGVVAANIAARLANEAYKAATLTAGTSGDATCAVPTVTAGQQGSCAVLDESVTLEVTIPGVTAGTYDIVTTIHDYVDKTLKNRQRVNPEDQYNQTTSDTSSEINSLARAMDSAAAIDLGVLKVSSSEFPVLKTDSIQDTKSALSDNVYKEEQFIWVSGENKYSTSSNRLEGKMTNLAYTIRFTNDDYGIPVCTATNPADGYYGNCTTTSSDATANHRMRIWFLGEKWVLTGMSQPVSTTDGIGNTTTNSGISRGGSIRLAKESSYKIISVGEVIDAGEIKVRLADISVAEGAENAHPAIVDILDANDNLLDQTKISVGSTFSYKTPSGKIAKIYIYKTAAGVTLAAKWAEIAVLSEELTLQNGQAVDNEDNVRYKVYLGWKNRNIQSSPTSWANADNVDALREITIYYDTRESGMVPGDSFTLLKQPDTFKLTFGGSDLTEAEKDALHFSIETDASLMVQNITGLNSSTAVACTNSNDAASTLSNALVKVTTSTGNFEVGFDSVTTFYVDPRTGTIYAKTSPSCTNYAAYPIRETTTGTTATTDGTYTSARKYVKYRTAGDLISGTPVGITTGAIEFKWGNAAGATDTTSIGAGLGTGGLQVNIYEDAGRIGSTTMTALSNMSFNITSTADFNATQRILPTGSATKSILYGISPSADVPTITSNPDAPFITVRGSEFRDMTSDSADFKIAKRVANVKWTLSTQSTAAISGDTYTLKEGAEQTLSNGVKIKVKSIDETLGACSAGGAGAASCTVDSTAVTAVILPDNVAQVTTTVPYKLADSLVVMDSAADAAGLVISVGGPAVSTVSADALAGSSVDIATQGVVVKKIGNVIVVAGQTAADTQTAGNQFLSELVRS